MTVAKLATDLPLWPEAPFRARISPRYEIRMGDWQGRKLAVVWDPQNQMQASGYLNDQGSWSDADLENVMNNLAGATFINKHGFEAMTQVLAAKKINFRALSPEMKELIRVYDSLYAWRADASAPELQAQPAA